MACTWFGEISSCSSLTALPGSARVLLSKICKPFAGSLYNSPSSPAVASAEMESVELDMEMPPLDVNIRPSISSSASLAFDGVSNTVNTRWINTIRTGN